MTKARLKSPNLDDRTWQDLVDQAKKLIPKYTKEWTDHNPSDPGIVLIELFAWLMEQAIYRLNRVPKKYKIEFLKLMGIVRRPPNPAHVDVKFQISGDHPVEIPKGTQVSTPPQGERDGIVFETDRKFTAMPLSACVLVDVNAKTYQNLSAALLQNADETVEINMNPGAPKMLVIGVALSEAVETPLTITLDVTKRRESDVPQWKYSAGEAKNRTFALLENVRSETLGRLSENRFGFDQPGRVEFSADKTKWKKQTLKDHNWKPATDDDKLEDPLFWIAIDFKEALIARGGDINFKIRAIAGDTISAHNTMTVENETLGVSNGEARQIFQLRNQPLFQEAWEDDQLNHVKIVVKSSTGEENEWKCVDGFSAVVGGEREFLCDPVTGEIRFGGQTSSSSTTGSGSGLAPETENTTTKQFGKIPPEGSRIIAKRYRYVPNGADANVSKGKITILRKPGPNMAGVSNEKPARGGTDWESQEQALQRGPEALKNRNRAVTIEDYERLAKLASTEIAIVRCLGPKWNPKKNTYVITPIDRTPGKVNLIVAPAASIEERQPFPTEALKTDLLFYFVPRKVVTSELFVHNPLFVEIFVDCEIIIPDGHDKIQMEKVVKNELFHFFHPVDQSGLVAKTWEFGENVYLPDVFEVVRRIPNVLYVKKFLVKPANERPEELLPTEVRVPIDDHELVCAAPIESFNVTVVD